MTGEELTTSIVVPTWRRPADLTRCLAGVARQVLAPTEIVVVVRKDDGASREALASIPQPSRYRLHVAFVERPGLVAALNRGYESTAGEIVCCLDDDAVPHDDWLQRLVRHYRDVRIVAVGGRDWVHEGDRRVEGQVATVGKITRFGRCIGNHHLGAGDSREVDFLKGVNLSYRRSAVSGLPFDPMLHGSGTQPHSEIGLCLRLARGGRIVYDPAVGVEHFLGTRWEEQRAEDRSLADIEVSSHNRFYGLMAELSGSRRFIVFLFQLLVGSRDEPGPALVVERLLHGDGSALARGRTATAGRLFALRTLWRRGRRD